ncbi:formyl transferase, partial [Pseudomonas sp. FW305-130]
HGLPRPGLATAAEPVALAPYEASPEGPEPGGSGADLVLALSGSPAEPGSAPAWRLDYDGMPGEAGLLAALFAHGAPVAALRGPDG